MSEINEILPPDWNEEKEMIKVIGVGGGGCNAVNYMYNQKIEGCSFIVCNTDADKCMYSRLFPDVRKPETIVKNIAGYYYNGDTGINNVCIGRNAGFNAYHNGQNNVYIGAEARAVVPGASASSQKVCSNSIAIGKGAYVTGSFQIVIGNQNYTTVKIAGKTLKFNDDGTVTWE